METGFLSWAFDIARRFHAPPGLILSKPSDTIKRAGGSLLSNPANFLAQHPGSRDEVDAAPSRSNALRWNA